MGIEVLNKSLEIHNNREKCKNAPRYHGQDLPSAEMHPSVATNYTHLVFHLKYKFEAPKTWPTTFTRLTVSAGISEGDTKFLQAMKLVPSKNIGSIVHLGKCYS